MIETNAFKSKHVVVTGGATGIGFAIANLFSQNGAKVAIGSRRDQAIQEAISASAGRLIGHTMDVAMRESVEHFFDWAATALGHVDILVNAAGVNILECPSSAGAKSSSAISARLASVRTNRSTTG